jgi:hypothetical protein
VLAAILAIGPVAVTASMFPRSARLALAAPDDPGKAVAVRILHRITRVYAVIGVLVPVFGLGMLTGVFNLLWVIVVVLMIYRPGSTTGVGL